MTHDSAASMLARYERRRSKLYQFLRPPLPLVPNQREARLPSCTGNKLFIGAAGSKVPSSFIRVDLVAFAGVDVAADIHQLPFADDSVSAIECDAVLEHVECPVDAVRECWRVLRPGGYLHIVVPFCHPFHEYPKDYQRWTLDGLAKLLSNFEIINSGMRTGPTATLLTFLLEYVKVLSPAPLKNRLRRVRLGGLAPALLGSLDQSKNGRAGASKSCLRISPEALGFAPSKLG